MSNNSRFAILESSFIFLLVISLSFSRKMLDLAEEYRALFGITVRIS